jgi:hypothetical protein
MLTFIHAYHFSNDISLYPIHKNSLKCGGCGGGGEKK